MLQSTLASSIGDWWAREADGFVEHAGMTADVLHKHTFASPQCACSDVWVGAAHARGLDLQDWPVLAHVGLDWVAIKVEPGLAGALHPADCNVMPLCVHPAGQAGRGWWDRSRREGAAHCSMSALAHAGTTGCAGVSTQ